MLTFVVYLGIIIDRVCAFSIKCPKWQEVVTPSPRADEVKSPPYLKNYSSNQPWKYPKSSFFSVFLRFWLSFPRSENSIDSDPPFLVLVLVLARPILIISENFMIFIHFIFIIFTSKFKIWLRIAKYFAETDKNTLNFSQIFLTYPFSETQFAQLSTIFILSTTKNKRIKL